MLRKTQAAGSSREWRRPGASGCESGGGRIPGDGDLRNEPNLVAIALTILLPARQGLDPRPSAGRAPGKRQANSLGNPGELGPAIGAAPPASDWVSSLTPPQDGISASCRRLWCRYRPSARSDLRRRRQSLHLLEFWRLGFLCGVCGRSAIPWDRVFVSPGFYRSPGADHFDAPPVRFWTIPPDAAAP